MRRGVAGVRLGRGRKKTLMTLTTLITLRTLTDSSAFASRAVELAEIRRVVVDFPPIFCKFAD